MVLVFYGIKALTRKTTNMEKGVYTAVCGECEQPNYFHVDGKGGFDPKRCRSCKSEFIDIEKAEKGKGYVAAVAAVGEEQEEETEATKKSDTKESFKLEIKEE